MNDLSPPSNWTRQRRKIRDWLRSIAVSLGELYEGAVRILFSEDPFPGRVRFVAHAVREIRNRLPDVIAGPKMGTRLDYINRMDNLLKEWRQAGFPLDGSAPIPIVGQASLPSNTNIPIPKQLYFELAKIVRDHHQTREKPTDAARRIFEAIDPNNKSDENALRPRINHWIDITNWFVQRVHDNGSTDTMVATIEELIGQFEVFEAAMFAVIEPFFETIKELDEILEEANS
ncbi:hypothetical protein [Bellilinea sp.]|uniref:hypothetical protein n=1 Tax=Bellilinea sp. TaxID=2838785 RepID=UPI002ADDE833|nr:hypothetical protein [Bellilinea sp.]